ncbi:hypothetical protein [Mucilaginibacter gynuensis]|uniref:hypothetical protein n=1 Tax=Mucilaginibacter gynuensis TaxID=1302236 RepID=UPI0031E86E18
MKQYQNHYFFFEGDSSEIDFLGDTESGREIAFKMNNFFAMFVHSIWFVKDNSAYVNYCVVEDLDNEKVFTNTKDILATNSTGEYANTNLSIDEVETFYNLLPYFFKLNVVDNQSEINLFGPDEMIHNAIPSEFNYIRYDYNRVKRAAYFLQLIRHNSNLIIKITFFVAIYECLFTSNPSEVTHQVSERAALYIGGDNLIKRVNYDLIREAYTIRSKYIHGSVVKNSREELLRICMSIDALTRQLFLKIRGNDEIFLLSDSEGDKKKFENYFKNLLFE